MEDKVEDEDAVELDAEDAQDTNGADNAGTNDPIVSQFRIFDPNLFGNNE